MAYVREHAVVKILYLQVLMTIYYYYITRARQQHVYHYHPASYCAGFRFPHSLLLHQKTSDGCPTMIFASSLTINQYEVPKKAKKNFQSGIFHPFFSFFFFWFNPFTAGFWPDCV